MLHKYVSPSILIVEVETDNLLQVISGESAPVMINVYDDSEDEKYSVNDAL